MTTFKNALVLVIFIAMFSASSMAAREIADYRTETVPVQILDVTMLKNGLPATSINSGDTVTVQVDITSNAGWTQARIYKISSSATNTGDWLITVLEFEPGITSVTSAPFVIENYVRTFENLFVTATNLVDYPSGLCDCICVNYRDIEICECDCAFIRTDAFSLPISVIGYTPIPPFIYSPPALWVLTGARAAGVPFEFRLDAEGTGNMVWKLESGELPPGLELDETGLIFGTPTRHGAFIFSASVESEYGRAERTFTLMIVEQQPPGSPFCRICELPADECSCSSVQITGVTMYRDGVAVTEIDSGDTVTLRVDLEWDAHSEREISWITGRVYVRAPHDDTEWLAGFLNFEYGVMYLTSDEFEIHNSYITVTEIFVSMSIYLSDVGEEEGDIRSEYVLPIIVRGYTPHPPHITTSPFLWSDDGYLQKYRTYAFNLRAVGTGTIEWSLVDGRLPAYMTLCTSGLLSGTPTQGGMFTVTARAESEYGWDEKEFHIIVVTEDEPNICTRCGYLPSACICPAPASGTVARITPICEFHGRFFIDTAFTSDMYTVSFAVKTTAPGKFGVYPSGHPANFLTFTDINSALAGFYEIEPGAWTTFSFTFHGGVARTGIYLAPEYPRTAPYYLDNIVIRNSANETLIAIDFEDGTAPAINPEHATLELLKPNFGGDELRITFNPNGGAFVNAADASRTIERGKNIGILPRATPQVLARENHRFAGWFENYDGRQWRDFDEVTGDITLYARWIRTPEDFRFGAAKRNGTISSADATQIAQWVVDDTITLDEQSLTADINGDGLITAEDVTLLARWLVGHDVQHLLARCA